MRKLVDGSKSVRGRKNRKNIKKQVARKPPSEAQTMPRRSRLTGSGSALSTTVLLLAAAEEPTVDGFGGGAAAFAGGAGFSAASVFATVGALTSTSVFGVLSWLTSCSVLIPKVPISASG